MYIPKISGSFSFTTHEKHRNNRNQFRKKNIIIHYHAVNGELDVMITEEEF